jgi:hypothetical protein
MGILIGDVIGDGKVRNKDIENVRSLLGRQANSSNFRDDVTLDGRNQQSGPANGAVAPRRIPAVTRDFGGPIWDQAPNASQSGGRNAILSI